MRTNSIASRDVAHTPGKSWLSAAKYRMPARACIMRATNMSGVRTEMPMPLSSQTNRIGHGWLCSVAAPAACRPACAVAWFSEASPKLQ